MLTEESSEGRVHAISRREALGLAGGAIAGAALLASTPRAASAAVSLPIGTWNINGNGALGKLVITGVDAAGKLTGTVYGEKVTGFWDEDARRITFVRIPASAGASSYQVYTGYYFRNSNGGSDLVDTLAGSFEAFAGRGGTAQRNVFGWFARINIIG